METGYDSVIKGLKFGIPRIIRIFVRDLREKAPTGRFNTLSGYLCGYSRLHSFQRAYRWAIANGFKKPVRMKRCDNQIPYSVFDYYPY